MPSEFQHSRVKTEMAAPSPFHGSKCTARSISLPTRLHPHSLRIEAELNKLKTWEASCSSIVAPPGAETIQVGLAGVMELYNYVQEIIHSPLTRQALLRHQHRKLVDEALDWSVTLLDACGTAKDILSMTKGYVQILQSALRRKGLDSSNISSYISFRKKAKKDVTKCIGSLQKMESKLGYSPLLNLDHHLMVVVRLLREVSSIAISTFRTLLQFFSMPGGRKMFDGLSLITKLVSMNSGKGEKILNEVGSVDVAIHSLQEQLRGGGGGDGKVELGVVQRRLETLNVSVEGLEAGVDCMYRCLVQNRVSLLNLLTQ